MPNNTLLTWIANIGVKKNDQPWEILLTRKLNSSSFLGFINVCLDLFLLIGYSGSVYELLLVFALAPLVLVLNSKFNYIVASYLFTLISCFLFFFLSVKPARKPLLSFIFSMCFSFNANVGAKWNLCSPCCSIYFVFYYNFWNYFFISFWVFSVVISEALIAPVMYINILLIFFIALAFIFIISFDGNKQEKQINSVLGENFFYWQNYFTGLKTI